MPPQLRGQEEDIVQEAFLRVYRFGNSEGFSTFSASYLWKAAHSALLDEIRKASRRRENQVLEVDLLAPPTQASNPERESLGSEIGRAIRKCLAQLPRARRHAVTLRLLGYTVPEASGLLQWSYKRTENLVYRGLASLRRCLAESGVRP